MRTLVPSTAARILLGGLVAIAALGCFGCSKDKSKDEGASSAPPPPPPPVASAKPGACSGGGGEVGDPATASFFPRSISAGGNAWCLDPQGETRTYGEKAKLSMDEVCTTAVDGECEVYKRFGLKRFVSLRYVDGSGSGGTVEVYLSQFADPNGAYGMFTKRVIADGDPADPSAPKPVQAGGAAALGTGRGYVWKGAYVAELQYINENESPEQIAKNSEPVLSSLEKEIGDKLPGNADKPASAKALPTENLVSPNAIQFYPKEPLGFANVGAGAVGYYRDGAKRWRLLAIQRDDVEQAKDAMKTIKSKPGALPVAGLFDEAVHVVVQPAPEAAKVDWVIARKGSLVAGAGDEEYAMKPGEAEGKQTAARLTKDEAAAKLRAWLSAAPATTAADAGSKAAPKK